MRTLVAIIIGGIMIAGAALVPSYFIHNPILNAPSQMITIHAQTLPINRNFAWDVVPDPCVAPEVPCPVLDYTTTLDGVALAVTTGLKVPFSLATAGKHTLTVAARNTWLMSPVSSITINVVGPARPNNTRVEP